MARLLWLFLFILSFSLNSFAGQLWRYERTFFGKDSQGRGCRATITMPYGSRNPIRVRLYFGKTDFLIEIPAYLRRLFNEKTIYPPRTATRGELVVNRPDYQLLIQAPRNMPDYRFMVRYIPGVTALFSLYPTFALRGIHLRDTQDKPYDCYFAFPGLIE